jgi:DNA-3-methyladenine glycosylase
MNKGLTSLPREFYARDCEAVARDLLGKLLVRNTINSTKVARIVETEAYLGPHDLAAHSSKGRTSRTEVLFGSAGHVYMYLIYGIYNMLNITTAEPGAAVLVRAVEPVSGIDSKTSGPGLLTKALELDRTHYGVDLVTDPSFFVTEDSFQVEGILASPRIGVDYAGEWKEKLLRFHISGNKFVSR